MIEREVKGFTQDEAKDSGGDSARALDACPAQTDGKQFASGLRVGPSGFWEAGDGVHALDDPTPHGQENALQKLGRPPFEKTPRGRFRLLGYLATVYEHVSRDVGQADADENNDAGRREADSGDGATKR